MLSINWGINACRERMRSGQVMRHVSARALLPASIVCRIRNQAGGSPSSRGRHVGDSFMRAFRKPVHEVSKTPVLGLKLLHLEQSRRGQAAIALAPPIKSARRYVSRAANFGN